MLLCMRVRCVNVVVCGVIVWEVSDEWMLVPGRTSRLLGRACWWVALLVGSRIDCCHTRADFKRITDTGLKAFSAALRSSTTITTVTLGSTSACPVCCCTCGCVRSLCRCDAVLCACVTSA